MLRVLAVHFDDELRAERALELGDVLWYVAQLASELGYELEDVANQNLSKLRDRSARGQLKGSGEHR